MNLCGRDFFVGRARDLAPRLLGCVLVGRGVSLRITEVEAYEGDIDPGSHAYRGRTARNATMFREGGHLYVYRHLGIHHCMNIVSGTAGTATGCLVRAGEVVAGIDVARGRRSAAGRTTKDTDLAQGPGRATVAMGITLHDDGTDLCAPDSPFHLYAPPHPHRPSHLSAPDHQPHATRSGLIGTSVRIGLRPEASDPAHYAWRYFLLGDPTISGPASLNRSPSSVI
ncbi:DNA-3-methyladenine glycosylase [Devriesea agamarum]|uniref:DNA-3-methyladenine glycosylase n=1 Tax=Devriesea agamarum TaxID=472569 RepID=UPI00071C257B|nr:DNA-3-methyladenine glycosylase [Devriesea agamarum]